MKQALEALNEIDSTLLSVDNFYSVRIGRDDIFLLGKCTEKLLKKCADVGFKLEFIEKNYWFEKTIDYSGYKVNITLTIH